MLLTRAVTRARPSLQHLWPAGLESRRDAAFLLAWKGRRGSALTLSSHSGPECKASPRKLDPAALKSMGVSPLTSVGAGSSPGFQRSILLRILQEENTSKAEAPVMIYVTNQHNVNCKYYNQNFSFSTRGSSVQMFTENKHERITALDSKFTHAFD
uniref:Uncharacterized protein n=1 Tax=Chelydra serpentina TaxID=8475 RepID=A0A8C3RSR9_CHESE